MLLLPRARAIQPGVLERLCCVLGAQRGDEYRPHLGPRGAQGGARRTHGTLGALLLAVPFGVGGGHRSRCVAKPGFGGAGAAGRGLDQLHGAVVWKRRSYGKREPSAVSKRDVCGAFPATRRLFANRALAFRTRAARARSVCSPAVTPLPLAQSCVCSMAILRPVA